MTVIVADLGASNARFAVLQDGKVSDSYQFACDDFRNPEKMIASFKNNYAPDATAFVAGVAGVVLGPGPTENGKSVFLNFKKN